VDTNRDSTICGHLGLTRLVNNMTRYFFDATPDRHQIVLINAATVRKAAALIETCEHCNEEGSEYPFVVILDRVTGSDPKVTDYILEVPANCPACRCQIVEKTLVQRA
jgi:hypothetical protein